MAGDLAVSGRLKREAPLGGRGSAATDHLTDGLGTAADLSCGRSLRPDDFYCANQSLRSVHRLGLQVFLQSVNKKSCKATAQAILYRSGMGTIGSRARQRREALGLSLPGLAARVEQVTGTKITWQSLQQLETSDAGGTKHLVPLARALGVNTDWLYDESAPLTADERPEALLVGKVGAGAEITRFDEGAMLQGIEPPAGVGPCNAAEIVGDSQYPLQDGWIVFYGPEHRGISEDCIGKLCVVQVKDGPTLLKTLKKAGRRGLFRLESWNAPPREDVKVEWAAKVIDIRPR